MSPTPFCLVTDRGGHLQNALMLIEQMEIQPNWIVTTEGPDIDALKSGKVHVSSLPYLFQWVGKTRFFNPWRPVVQIFECLRLIRRHRPTKVVSLGASNVVIFCYIAKIYGAEVFHVECMNQVKTASITGRLLYPICERLFVQWEELLKVYGAKATYAGWVL